MEYQEIDEDNMLVGEFLTPQIIQSQYEIDEDNMLVGEFFADHPNFSWNDNYNNIISQGLQFQQLEKRTSLEDILGKFIEKTNQFMRQTEINLQNQSASIKNLEIQMGQMTVAISGSVPDTLPINTEVNTKENVTAITTRNEVQLPEIYVKRPVGNKENESSTDEEHMEQTEQTIDIKESSDTPRVKATFLSNHTSLQSHCLRDYNSTS
ncbi:reverse transcriptase [Abeliophyllum distichum]|uniref:Reverse transcriptase n=1 Tax=Abeliophyllum distichum TaxID=126358 RepID=A0ABD1RDH1_9LAMI